MGYFCRKVKLLLLVLVQGNLLHSQSISGKILDSLNQPVEYSPLALLRQADSSIYSGVITNDKGEFVFENVDTGNYFLKIDLPGYRKHYSEVFSMNTENVVLPSAILRLDNQIQLNEVTVGALRKTIEFKGGNITVDVANSALAMGNTAFDLIKKLPGVMVDDERIVIQGREGVKIMINGRIQEMSPRQLINLLKNTSASTIDKIEILKNPPVKYDASGTAGIIHIKTKKTTLSGASGSFGTSGSQGSYPRGESAFSLNYKTKSILFFTDISSEYGTYYTVNKFNKEVEYNNKITSLDQTLIQTEDEFGLQANVGADFYVNSKNTLGIKVTAAPARSLSKTRGSNFLSDSAMGYDHLIFNYSTLNVWNYPNYNINAEHLFDTTGTKLMFSADYSPNWDTYDSHFDNRFLQNDLETATPRIYQTYDRDDVKLFSSKLDFQKQLFKEVQMECGVKGTNELFKREYIIENKNNVNSEFEKDTLYSKHFNYNEQVLAGYIDLQKEVAGCELEIGLRAENTDISALVPENNFKIRRKYFNLFPLVSAEFEPGEKHNLQISYNRRINRPDCYSYYPYKSFWNDILVNDLGNPNLLPEYSNTFEFTHTYNEVISNAFAYSRVSDYIIWYSMQNDSSKVTTVTLSNLKNSSTWGYTLFGQLKIKKWWTLNLNGSVSYFSYKGKIEGQEYSAGAFSYFGFLTNEFLVSKKSRLEINTQYFGPRLWGVFNNRYRWSLNLAYKTTLFNEKLNLSVGVDDIFYTLIQSNDVSFQGQHFTIRETNDTRRFRISLSYNFGKMKIERRETNSNEEEKEKLKH